MGLVTCFTRLVYLRIDLLNCISLRLAAQAKRTQLKRQVAIFVPERDERHRYDGRVITCPRDDIAGQDADASVFLLAIALTKHLVVRVAQL